MNTVYADSAGPMWIPISFLISILFLICLTVPPFSRMLVPPSRSQSRALFIRCIAAALFITTVYSVLVFASDVEATKEIVQRSNGRFHHNFETVTFYDFIICATPAFITFIVALFKTRNTTPTVICKLEP